MKLQAKQYLIAGSCLLIVAVGLVVQRFWPEKAQSLHTNNPSTNQFNNLQATGLNGQMVSQEVAEQRPVAVVIDNQPDARPQAGLSEADIVYETLAEGGITRFLALYQTKASKNVGPIRSARIYFNELAEEWSALYAHVGGNSDALDALKQNTYEHIANADQFFFDSYFHRINARKAPHNAYTSIDTLYELSRHEGWDLKTTPVPGWKYALTTIQTTLPQRIFIPFSTPEYAVLYTYNPKENLYLRSVAGKATLDANTGAPLKPSNVIIQFAAVHPTKTDTLGSLSFNLDASGKAVGMSGGTSTQGRWEKTDGHTKFIDASGKEMELNPGQTWIEIVPIELAPQVTIK